MFDLYVTISDKTPEVMIIDCDILRVRSHLRRNWECDCPLVVFVKCYRIFENTAQHRQGVSLKLGYELNLLHKNHKRKDVPHCLI